MMLLTRILLVGAALVAAASQGARASTLPPGFVEVTTAGLTSPTALAVAPDGRIFVAQQGGSLRVIKHGALLPSPFVSLSVDSTGERGLLGVAFDPDFVRNQYVYVYSTTSVAPIHNRVSRFTASGDVALAGSEQVIFELDPLSTRTNHNGGALHFAPDGTLFIASGENGSGPNAQSLANVLGKILRINADGSIPTDNPFWGTAAGSNRAIWALGLRNPYTFAFQPGTGRIFINDVGEVTWEEVNEGVRGANYGWPDTEGPTSDARFRSPIFAGIPAARPRSLPPAARRAAHRHAHGRARARRPGGARARARPQPVDEPRPRLPPRRATPPARRGFGVLGATPQEGLGGEREVRLRGIRRPPGRSELRGPQARVLAGESIGRDAMAPGPLGLGQRAEHDVAHERVRDPPPSLGQLRQEARLDEGRELAVEVVDPGGAGEPGALERLGEDRAPLEHRPGRRREAGHALAGRLRHGARHDELDGRRSLGAPLGENDRPRIGERAQELLAEEGVTGRSSEHGSSQRIADVLGAQECADQLSYLLGREAARRAARRPAGRRGGRCSSARAPVSRRPRNGGRRAPAGGNDRRRPPRSSARRP